ncbi:OmpA family protein [Croceicoccus marinus]|jgi:outer membrane protein OmpA-like peptidoglycan-associated protein|uniref:OmpA family protein n=1 Tax=Croceicoccus marinus TaxID=450378 RepID=A0A7G6VST5_9SPHN|nr:OmpA family protein [Croceicoccus marinus]QNE04800.1 OmpA family protein [Croceicoccus marinus]
MRLRTVRSFAAKSVAGSLAMVLGQLAFSQPALAQYEVQTGQDLTALGDGELRDALQMRYDASLAATLDPAIVNATDARFHWASEAKVQCAIALGFMKNDLRDGDSIRKCNAAYERLMTPPAPPAPPLPPPPPEPVRPPICDQSVNTVFFDFDSRSAPPTAAATARFLQSNTQICGWTGFDVVGHTDRSGPEAYNQALSVDRAEAVADVMTAQGIPESMISITGRGESDPAVPTVDGERNPQNRRVTVSIRQGAE